MKRILLFTLFFALNTSQLSASFYARKLGPNTYFSWSRTQISKCETQVELYGLFYETTITLKLKLGAEWRYWESKCILPEAGQYEFIWNFNLPKSSFIKELKIWDNATSSYKSADPLSLTVGEQNYNNSYTSKTSVLLRQYMKRDYNGQFNLQYDLRISPVNYTDDVEFIIRYISPCKMLFNKRLVRDYSYQFYTVYNYENSCYTDEKAALMFTDQNNPSVMPLYYSGTKLNWTKNNTFWRADTNKTYNEFAVYFPEESITNGKFLRTSTNGELNFFQLSAKPFIQDSERPGRNIVLALDITQKNYFSAYSRDNFYSTLKDAIKISTTEKDSLAFVTSDFNVKWLDDRFKPRTESLINNRLDEIKNIYPQLNTLPYMLKEIVGFLNDKSKDAEVWIISDDYKTGVRAETVMELLQQTFYKARKKIVFSIADIAYNYNGYYIQNKYYRGNEYLYENLTRLSGGNFQKIYNYYYIDYIDAFLDCYSPTVTTVEVEPLITSGVAHSMQNLNNGRYNFNLTQRYYLYGIWEGFLPMTLNYFGNYRESLYTKTFTLEDDPLQISSSVEKNTELYWYGNYILNDLFLQPQSYTTIKYIEDLSVKEHLITPYTAFVIPGPNGYIGYKRIYEDEVVSVEDSHQDNGMDEIPSIIMDSYPNPFNPSTTISLRINSKLLRNEKSLEIYNLLGQKIKSFDLNELNNISDVKVSWNGDNDFGSNVSSGIYFALFRCGSFVKSIKMQLIR